MSISPFASFSFIICLFFLVILDTKSSHLMPNWFNVFWKFSICWVASIAVGANIAAWYPDFTALYAAIMLTIVLPDPTSPWSNLFIGLSLSISLLISFKTLIWAFVSLNGNVFITSIIFTFLSKAIPFSSVL